MLGNSILRSKFSDVNPIQKIIFSYHWSVLAAVFGICATMACLFTIPSGYVNELKPVTIPQWTFVVMSVIPLFVIRLLSIPDSQKVKPSNN